jgi:HPt (histidine-containing phosphotransfer) domain-containing protein
VKPEIPPIPESLAAGPTWHDLLAIFHQNQRLLGDVLRLFSREAPHLCRAFRRAVETGEARQAQRAAHTLKSNCRQFKLDPFSGFAQALERLAECGDTDSLRLYLPAVDAMGIGIADWCERLLEDNCS